MIGSVSDVTILIVDDNASNLRLLAKILKEQGYKVRPMRKPETVFSYVLQSPPDIILLDIRMPGMDGYEVCRTLKDHPETADIPIIFISVRDDSKARVKGFEAGAVDYVTKPFNSPELLARIKTHLTIQKLRQNLSHEKKRFEALSEAASEGIIFHEQGIIRETNSAMETLTGYSRKELMGKNFPELISPEFKNTAEEKIKIKDTEPFEIVLKHKSGSKTPVEIQIKNIFYGKKDVRVIAARDISWRKELKTMVEKTRTLESENIVLKVSLSNRSHLGELYGSSLAMQKVYDRIIRAAAVNHTMIIYGETGTGKELAARTVFQLNSDYDKTFIPVNCAAVQENLIESQFFGYKKGAFTSAFQDTPGIFEKAHKGTLFLDEIGELTPAVQAKLLRVMENGEYTPVGSSRPKTADVRIIAATNKNLRQMVSEGKMREDFFNRLHIIAVELPPLRQHKEDIPLLISRFTSHNRLTAEDQPEIPESVMKQFYEYDWPGNVRELFNELRRYLIVREVELGGQSQEYYMPDKDLLMFREGLPLKKATEIFESQYISQALQKFGGEKKQAAKALGVTRRTLYNKLNISSQ